jgi:hypothetical protein
VATADADLDLIKDILLRDHLPGAVGSLHGADVEDGSGHQEGSGGDDHRDGAADARHVKHPLSLGGQCFDP